MAIETFTWATESGGEGDIAFATRSAQFGDGYKQLVSEGLNSKSQSWPVSITGPAATIKAAMDFLDRHAGARAFSDAAPGRPGLLHLCGLPARQPRRPGLPADRDL